MNNTGRGHRTENERPEKHRVEADRGRTPDGVPDGGGTAAKARTERELREAPEALAQGVQAAPDAYRTARVRMAAPRTPPTTRPHGPDRRRVRLGHTDRPVGPQPDPSDPGLIFSGTGPAVAVDRVTVLPG